MNNLVKANQTGLSNKPESIDVFDYISCNNISGTKKLLKAEGFSIAPRSQEEAAMMLADIVRREGKEGWVKIATIHPDREIFSTENKNISSSEAFLLNADSKSTPTPTSNSKGLSERNLNMLIIAGAGVIALTLVTMIATNSKS